MKTKIIEAVENSQFNWGKFLIGQFDTEFEYESVIDGRNLMRGRGWDKGHLLVLDLQTGEAAIFRGGGYAHSDLNTKHQIWVCPMYEPFLAWLYTQDLTDISTLPAKVNLGDVPTDMRGYRRTRKVADET